MEMVRRECADGVQSQNEMSPSNRRSRQDGFDKDELVCVIEEALQSFQARAGSVNKCGTEEKIRQLEWENARLRKLAADLSLENDMLARRTC